MKILVTGGAGYIGSFMVKAAIDKNYEVVVADSLERGNKEAIDLRTTLVVGDLKNKDFAASIFSKHKFDAVVHFAGYISMAESVNDPYLYFNNNVNASLNVIESMVSHGVNNFIFSSSAGVYGNPIKTPITEDHQKNPTNPYGESKLIVEQILSWYQKIHGLNFVSLRYFNAAGASLDAAIGENHNPETHIIPSAIKAILENKEFKLYGDDYKTKDGTCIRDYVHVVDLVEAHILAIDKLQKEKGGFFYNVGTGRGHSNSEVIEMIERICGTMLKVKIEKRRPGDADSLIADPRKIEEELGFSPKHSDLETIVKTAWEWHKRNSKFKIQNSKLQ